MKHDKESGGSQIRYKDKASEKMKQDKDGIYFLLTQFYDRKFNVRIMNANFKSTYCVIICSIKIIDIKMFYIILQLHSGRTG